MFQILLLKVFEFSPGQRRGAGTVGAVMAFDRHDEFGEAGAPEILRGPVKPADGILIPAPENAGDRFRTLYAFPSDDASALVGSRMSAAMAVTKAACRAFMSLIDSTASAASAAVLAFSFSPSRVPAIVSSRIAAVTAIGSVPKRRA